MTDTGRLSRAEKTAHLTEQIYQALLDDIAEVGWDNVSVSGTAKKAGVTAGAIYSRAENASELANLMWREWLLPDFEGVLVSLVAAAEGGSLGEFSRAAARFDRYARSNSVVFDVAMASLFDDELAEVVQQDISRILSDLIFKSDAGGRPPIQSAACTLLLCLFMGRALAIRARGRATKLDQSQLQILADFWHAPHETISASDVVPVAFLRQSTPVADSETILLRGVIETVAKWGFRRATISRIARATGMTPGAVLAVHKTKANLIKDAASALVNSPAEVWQQYAAVVDAMGPLRARAAFLAAFLDPEHAKFWRLNIELARVAEFTPELRSFRTPNDNLEHTHMGVMFVASFVDGIAGLPYAGSFSKGSTT